jgi:hypothetical protein
MTAHRDPDRLVHDFVLEGAERLHDQVYDAIRAEIEGRPQRVVIGPWRMPIMNKLMPLGLGTAAVVVVLVLGSRVLGPPSGSVGGPGVGSSPSPAASVAAPSPAASAAAPSPSASTVPPPLTGTFTSERHGFSISYPAGWVARSATAPWTKDIPDFMSAAGDILYDRVREASLWIAVASQPIGTSTPGDWVAGKLAFDDGCTRSEPIAVDGATGRIGADGCTRAAVTIDGRGYFFWLYTSGDEPSLAVTYGRAWFEVVLATVQLQPGAAVDVAPSASR